MILTLTSLRNLVNKGIVAVCRNVFGGFGQSQPKGFRKGFIAEAVKICGLWVGRSVVELHPPFHQDRSMYESWRIQTPTRGGKGMAQGLRAC